MKRYRSIDDPLAGAAVVVAGLFSARDKRYQEQLDELAALAESRGSRVVARFVQRRGASDRWNQRPGGAARMADPFSRRTLMTHGKIREIAEACRTADAAAAIFVNPLTPTQRTVLTRLLGCPVLTRDDLRAAPA
ncbi:hypothetical protein [Actinoplanes flavus]|uniref:GTPase HflX N-terminal domain-containing protein n=1 Tax=Actinoplanes flavus TaxID=2820290 RepID=A0ABS3UX07_9ACTN|nr:hypothetical protein [Actinoplanes flavus]MBO3743115.1 hypothetical protein [Actinoplanes flavus]